MIGIVYIILGILVLFFPGFLLSFLLFSGKGRLDFWERIAVSVGLSAFVDMLILTILAQPMFKALRLAPMIGSVAVFCAGCSILIFLRKKSLQTLLTFLKISGSSS